jgi:DNA-binding MarR family transcriptional regulator
MDTPAIFRVPAGFEGEWPGSNALATEVVLNVIRAGEALSSRVDAYVRSRGLPSSTALIVLEVLRGAGGPLQPSVIAQRSFLSRPALSSVLDTLERRELLSRETHADDRRRVQVRISAKGVAVIEALLPDLHRQEVGWTDGLTDRQRGVLLAGLGRLQGHLH